MHYKHILIKKMYSEDLREKVREIFKKDKNYRSVASKMVLQPSTVFYLIKNDYSRLKKKTGPRKKVTSRQTTKIKLEVKRL